MHSAIKILLLAITTCVAHYPGYDSRDLIIREETALEEEGILVECPVCREVRWLPSQEECPIIQGNKKYKRCPRGTYVNEVCDNRLDCYRGPGDQCTEKMNNDVYGQRCAHGYYCDDKFHKCTGSDYSIENAIRYVIDHGYRYQLKTLRPTNQPEIKSIVLA